MSGRVRTRGKLYNSPSPYLGHWPVVHTRKQYKGTELFPQYRELVNDYTNYVTPYSNYETITDNVGQPNKFNACTHDVRNPVSFSFPAGTKSKPIPTSYVSNWITYEHEYTGGEAHWSFEVPMDGDYPSIPDTLDWATLVDNVGSQLDGHMVSRNNILVTIGELAKTVGMIKRPLASLRSLRPLNSKVLFSGSTLRALASTHLEIKYGWKQLYRDITAYAVMHEKVRDHIRHLRDHVNQEMSVHSRHVDVTTAADEKTEIGDTTVGWNFTRCSRTSTFSLKYVMPQGVAEIAKLEHYFDASGVKNVVEALWDLVPFSFVVDWFINWKYLGAYDPVFWNSHRVSKLGYSQKSEWYVRPYVDFVSPFWSGSYARDTWAGQESLLRSLYVRTPGFPPSGLTGLFSTLTNTNLFDGAALILQRI